MVECGSRMGAEVSEGELKEMTFEMKKKWLHQAGPCKQSQDGETSEILAAER